jgi:uncharacterized protein YbdZ (MbtH family)
VFLQQVSGRRIVVDATRLPRLQDLLATCREKKVSHSVEEDNEKYFVLINAEEQHSLWSVFVPVPNGWSVIHGPESRAACLDFVGKNWTDMRPKSLRDRMARGTSS